jgi:hypothetical protein
VRRLSWCLVVLALSGCFQAPKYNWVGRDPSTLQADEQACVAHTRETYPFGSTYGGLFNDPIRKTEFKDCMEARGWVKQ